MSYSLPGFVPPVRRRVYLMRHGDVCYFQREDPEVRSNDAQLSPVGLEQAAAAGRALAEIPLDRVLTSGMPRSQQTAEIVLRGRELAIGAHGAFREISPGHLRDIPLDQVPAIVTGAFTNNLARDTRFLGGETFGSLWDRVLEGWNQVVADREWRHLLLVAHGGVNRVILSHALGAGLATFGAIEQDPGCINVIDLEDSGRMLVRLMNDTPYNPLKCGLELTTMERLFVDYLDSIAGR